jgi:hypothetical protein
MNCMVCGRETSLNDLAVGPYCSDAHLERLVEEERHLHAELLAEPPELMPEAFADADLDRLTLKIALLILDALPPEEKKKQLRNNRWILPPEQMAVAIKVKIIGQLPARYRSCFCLHGAARIFFSQTHRTRTKIPKDVILTALERSDFLHFVGGA